MSSNGGRKSRKDKNTKSKKGTAAETKEKRELEFRQDSEVYGKVVKLVGDARALVKCFDGRERICSIRGSMRKAKRRVWIQTDDIVLVALREYQDDKGDLVHKYYPDEVLSLKKLGEIPDDHLQQGEEQIMFEEEIEEFESPPASLRSSSVF